MALLLKMANIHFATMPIIVGIGLLLKPAYISKLIFRDAPISHQTGANTELVDILRAGFASRDIYMGLMLWSALWTGDRRAIGRSLLIALVVVVIDGWALQSAMGKGLWDHWGFIPVVLVVGGKQALF